jgi:hypothetical protein
MRNAIGWAWALLMMATCGCGGSPAGECPVEAPPNIPQSCLTDSGVTQECEAILSEWQAYYADWTKDCL